jgi:uncharacterized protein (DUF2235 family)
MAARNLRTGMKRLILCCDGTWQASDSGEKNRVATNVTKFCMALNASARLPGHDDEIPQIVYYQSGLGSSTLSTMGKAIVGMLKLRGMQYNSIH